MKKDTFNCLFPSLIIPQLLVRLYIGVTDDMACFCVQSCTAAVHACIGVFNL